jgi:hypothetical protein
MLLDNEQYEKAFEAIRLLYRLQVIDIFEYESLIVKIQLNVGA